MFFEILFLDVCLNVCLFFLGWGGIEKSLVSFGLILYGFVQCPNQHLRTEHLRLAMAIPALRHRSCLFPGPKEPEIDCDMWFLLIVVKDTLRPTKWLELRKQPRLFQVGFSDSLGNCAENLDAGRSLVDLDFSREGDGEQQFCTPFFARPGGSLHLGACYSVVPENPGHKDSKLLEFCEFLDGFGGFWWISAAGGWIWMVFECFWLFLILSLWFLIVFAWKNNAKRWWNHFDEQSNLSMSWICWLDDGVIWSLISSALFGFSWPFLGDHGSIWMAQGFWRSREWLPGWMTFKVDGLEIVECPGCSKNLGKIWKMEKHMKTTL